MIDNLGNLCIAGTDPLIDFSIQWTQVLGNNEGREF